MSSPMKLQTSQDLGGAGKFAEDYRQQLLKNHGLDLYRPFIYKWDMPKQGTEKNEAHTPHTPRDDLRHGFEPGSQAGFPTVCKAFQTIMQSTCPLILYIICMNIMSWFGIWATDSPFSRPLINLSIVRSDISCEQRWGLLQSANRRMFQSHITHSCCQWIFFASR